MIKHNISAHVRSNDFPAFPNAVFHADGMVLVGRMINGQFFAYPTNGKDGIADNEVFLGFTHMRMTGQPHDQLYTVRVEQQLVGPSGKGRLQQIPLPLTAGAYDLTAKALDPAVTFDNEGNFMGATAGHDYEFKYRWALSRQNRISLFGDAQPGGYSGGVVGQIGCIQSAEILYTDQFDTTVDWRCGHVVHTLATGQLTTSASADKGIALPGITVLEAPSHDIPYLGIMFTAGNI